MPTMTLSILKTICRATLTLCTSVSALVARHVWGRVPVPSTPLLYPSHPSPLPLPFISPTPPIHLPYPFHSSPLPPFPSFYLPFLPPLLFPLSFPLLSLLLSLPSSPLSPSPPLNPIQFICDTKITSTNEYINIKCQKGTKAGTALL